MDRTTWVTSAAEQPNSLHIRRCRLEVIAGPDAGLSCELSSPMFRIGARHGADLRLSDRKVSGFHCEIRVEEAGCRLRDLASRNGTYLGEHRIVEAFLGPGSVIRVGDTRARFDPLGDMVALPISTADRFGSLLGRTPIMRALFARLERVAASDATVLVTGETGTGKELVAEAIHEHSARASGPFVVVDCGAIPANLFESELFGHERGAFTGATSTMIGAFEQGHGGTVFLDEIGELPLDLQPKLLRVLERKTVRRVGGSKTIDVDIRLVAATNRDLPQEINRGRFREDLYYRLAVVGVEVPPLRQRKEDIPLLVEHFLAGVPGGQHAWLDAETRQLLQAQDWPGNVRELRNFIERLIHAASTPMPAPELPSASDVKPSEHIDTDVPFKEARKLAVEDFERRYLRALLERHEGKLATAARATGIDRVTLYKLMRRLGLDLKRRLD